MGKLREGPSFSSSCLVENKRQSDTPRNITQNLFINEFSRNYSKLAKKVFFTSLLLSTSEIFLFLLILMEFSPVVSKSLMSLIYKYASVQVEERI